MTTRDENLDPSILTLDEVRGLHPLAGAVLDQMGATSPEELTGLLDAASYGAIKQALPGFTVLSDMSSFVTENADEVAKCVLDQMDFWGMSFDEYLGRRGLDSNFLIRALVYGETDLITPVFAHTVVEDVGNAIRQALYARRQGSQKGSE